jgi:hypothetical protein
MVQILLHAGAIAVQDFRRLRMYHGSKHGRRRLRSVAVQNWVGATNLSWYRSIGCGQMRVSGYSDPYKFILPARVRKVEKDQKKKNVRAHTQLAVFDGLAFKNPAKTVTSLLMLPSVLGLDLFFNVNVHCMSVE